MHTSSSDKGQVCPEPFHALTYLRPKLNNKCVAVEMFSAFVVIVGTCECSHHSLLGLTFLYKRWPSVL